MKFIEKYIEWLVAIALVFGCSFDVVRQGLNVIEAKSILRYVNIINYIILFCLYLYQSKHYRVKIYSNPFSCFFIIYYVVVLLDMTILRVYPLDQLNSVPSSVVGYFTSLFRLVLYLMCIDTIVNKFSVFKFLILAVVCGLLPSLFYIQLFGMEAIQASEIVSNDDEYLSGLTMGYTCAPLIVLSIFYTKNILRSKRKSLFTSLCVVLASFYIFIALGERGPMLWTMVNIFICYYVMTKKRAYIFVFTIIMGMSLFLTKDYLLESLNDVAPKTATKIIQSIEEGDTNGRFDLKHRKTSTYLIGIDNFYSSPIIGSYFRLKTNYSPFKGHYPHNVFIEVLMTLGIFGFILFLYLILISYRNCTRLFRGKAVDNSFAFMILFLASFLMLQTSKSLLFRVDFWFPFYVLCSLPYIKHNIAKRLSANSNIKI